MRTPEQAARKRWNREFNQRRTARKRIEREILFLLNHTNKLARLPKQGR